MKPTFLGLAITFLCLQTNTSFAIPNSNNISYNEWEQVQESELTDQEKDNIKKNKKALEQINEVIKNLEDKKKADKVEALKAMRDHIKNNLKKDPATILDKAADKGKETTSLKNNKKELKDYIDKIHSEVAKLIFDLVVTARGTGRTTGHIAELSVINNSNRYFSIQPELVYIPLSNKYQGYIGYIPEYITIGPGLKAVIPINGYCANPHVPPVPLGHIMPNPSEWISINETPTGGFGLDGNPPMIPEPMNPPGGSSGPPQAIINITVSDVPPSPSFDPGMIGIMKSSAGYLEDSKDEEDSNINVSWPGTLEQIKGSFDPKIDPISFGQLAAEGLLLIIEAAEQIQKSGYYITPFSNDKEREMEAIIQQTFWIFVADLMGEEYDMEDFTNNVYQQFEDATGQSVNELPVQQKDQVNSGVVDFWNVYSAVGVEAKVFSTDPTPVPISNPEETLPIQETNEDCCTSMSSCYFNPKLDFDMKIADQWADATERRKIEREARKSMENNIDIQEEDAFDEFDISKNPTSATSFWRPGVVGGFASAYAKTWFRKADGNWEWVWGTEKLDTDAGGTMNCSLSYDTDEDCRALVAGTALIRMRASSSAFDAMAGNRHDEDDTDQLAFLRTTKYAAEKALEWLILRGRGRTTQSFSQHVKDDLKENIEGEITATVEEEIQNLAGEYLKEYLNQLGITAEDLSLSNLEFPDLEESLEELLGIDIPTLGDLENTISEGIEASLNLFFVANTYARASGHLVVKVGDVQGSVAAATSIHYGRQSAENTSETITWSGVECTENIISNVQPNGLTIHTEGYANLISEAVSKYGFGNGSAKAYLESMNLQMLTGLCIYEENDSTKFQLDVVGNMSWYGNSDTHQEEIKAALEPLENDIQNQLFKEISDFQKSQGNSSLENYTEEMLKNALEQKITKWADDHPFYWRDCTRE